MGETVQRCVRRRQKKQMVRHVVRDGYGGGVAKGYRPVAKLECEGQAVADALGRTPWADRDPRLLNAGRSVCQMRNNLQAERTRVVLAASLRAKSAEDLNLHATCNSTRHQQLYVPPTSFRCVFVCLRKSGIPSMASVRSDGAQFDVCHLHAEFSTAIHPGSANRMPWTLCMAVHIWRRLARDTSKYR